MSDQTEKSGQEPVGSGALLGVGTVLKSRCHGASAVVVKEDSDYVWLRHGPPKQKVRRNKRSTIRNFWARTEQCRHCHALEEPYWSRIMPMGYFCSKCGRPWSENDGVEMETPNVPMSEPPTKTL